LPARPRRFAPSAVLLAAVVVLGLAVGGLAVAAVSSSPSQIKACASKKTGALRVITKGKCAKSEKAVAWQKQGVAGRAGAAGAAGPAGPAGPAGATRVTVRTAQLAINQASCTPLFPGGPYSCIASGTATASCEPGERATGGGYSKPADSAVALPSVQETAPTPTSGTPTGWTVTVTGTTTAASGSPPPAEMSVRVICAAP
jgi:hypothetical protein